MADKIAQIQIQLQKRIARARGQTSSASYNDTIDEISHDFANFANQWNNSLVPLMADLPDSTVDSAIDAFTNGLSGATMYIDADATLAYHSSYYNTTEERPNTVYEQFVSIYTQMTSMQEDLEGQIGATVPAASIPIVDTASIYTAANVEAALQEVMTKLNLLVTSDLDLSAVAQHYIPATNNTWDIGTSSKKMRVVYTTQISIPALPEYANNTAALAGGLVAGDLFRETSTDPSSICVVY